MKSQHDARIGIGHALTRAAHGLRIPLATAILIAIAPGASQGAPSTDDDSLAAPAPAAWTIPLRTLMDYVDGAWTGRASVVLRSPDEWIRWNKSMVDAGRAYGPEDLPEGVDWNHEAVLVVTLGEQPTVTAVEFDEPRRKGRKVRIHGRIKSTLVQAISTPCRVVAFNRRHADDLELDPVLGTLEDPPGIPDEESERSPSDLRGSRGGGEIIAAPARAVAGEILELRATPNPSRGVTTLEYTLGQAGRIEAAVYDVSGRRVRSLVGDAGDSAPGAHRLAWDGRDETGAMTRAGLYFVRIGMEGDRNGARVVRIIAVR